jgi:hypothetical protein
MRWFKHDHNFRNTPAMKQIHRMYGNAGVAVAYRLLEVMTEHCGTGEKFRPELTLHLCRSPLWLAEELGVTEEREYGADMADAGKCVEMLKRFAEFGFITLQAEPSFNQNPETLKFDVPDPKNKIYTIGMDFAEMKDEWTASQTKGGDRKRKRVNVLSSPR